MLPPGRQIEVDWQHPINRDLFAWYPMRAPTQAAVADVARRESMQGTVTGTPVWRAGRDAAAVQLDGAQQINLPVPTQIVSPGAALSYSIWHRPAAFSNAYNALVRRSGASGGYMDFLVKSTGKLAPYAFTASGNRSYDGTGVHTLSAGVTYHLVMSYGPVAGLRGYVNGVLDGSATNGGALSAIITSAFTIGNNPPSFSTRYTTGAVWNARILLRELLAPEVSLLYAEPWVGVRRRDPLVAVPAAPAGGAVGGVLWSSIFRPGRRAA